jgi:iron complex transport system ATP-binding protein
VHNVSFAVAQGAIVGILGPNGSGKTTLLRLLAGTIQPISGRVTLEGVDLRDIRRMALARRMAVVPQETHLVFDYTVLEMALMGRHPHLGPFEVEGPDDFALAREALAATGTLAFEARSFNTLSGGEKQRVIIASALAQFGSRAASRGHGADILLLDEPTASLDLAYQLEIVSILAQLNRERGLTVIVSTHDLNLAAGLCDQLVLLRDGRLLALGPTKDVLTAHVVHELYGVRVDISTHGRTGQLTDVPLARDVNRRPH